MKVFALLRATVKAARKRRAAWVRLFDIVRLVPSAEGRARLWTRIIHHRAVHQTTPYTAFDRYPELFDLAAFLRPGAERVLSFGCSTGEELLALRKRFPRAELIGAEINPRSRGIARRRVAGDDRASVVAPQALDGPFDLIFALAVLQREPHKIAEMEIEDLGPYYPFARFNEAISDLANLLGAGALLCVEHAQYRVEDSIVAAQLKPVSESPLLTGPLFGPDGRRTGHEGRTIFRKV